MTIEKLRKDRGMSQIDLAALIGVTQGAVSQWEKGISSPSTDKLPELAKALKCEVSDLFE